MEVAKTWSSLEVPSVQELVKEKFTEVPDRYVLPDQETVISRSPDSQYEIPVIDFDILLNGDPNGKELEKLNNACKEWGFFQLINHGVSDSLVDKVKKEIDEFFKLPLEEKKKLVKLKGDPEGYGQNFVVSEEQKLDWADMLYMVTLPKDMQKPHLMPKLSVSFRNALEAYSLELKSMAMKILLLMAKALKMKPEEMEVLLEDSVQSMRMNYYPPCPQPDKVIGLSPHTDAIGLTILLELNETEGLQIRKDGNWIQVKPLPSAVVINIGDVLEIISNGAYPSIEHRGVVNSVKERLSLATFLSPKWDAEIGPAPSLLSSENPPKFKRISFGDFYKGILAKKLDGRCLPDRVRL